MHRRCGNAGERGRLVGGNVVVANVGATIGIGQSDHLAGAHAGIVESAERSNSEPIRAEQAGEHHAPGVGGRCGRTVEYLIAGYDTRDVDTRPGNVGAQTIQADKVIVTGIGPRKRVAGHCHTLRIARVFVRERADPDTAERHDVCADRTDDGGARQRGGGGAVIAAVARRQAG